jgi:CBS domain containing-hemolysin-like protein
VTTARLAFIIAFEHSIFFMVYLMKWLVQDIPKDIANKIKHERYIDQRERWSSKATEDDLAKAAASAAIVSQSVTRMIRNAEENKTRPEGDGTSPKSRRFRLQKGTSGAAIDDTNL